MQDCFMCKSQGVVATGLPEDWIRGLKRRNLIAYECPKYGDKWIGNDRNEMYSRDGSSISINDDMISKEERKKYLWDKYKVIYDVELFALGATEIDGNEIIDIYVEDDKSLYLKKSFHRDWLKDL